MALVGRHPIPAQGFGSALAAAPALFVQKPQIDLGCRRTLVGGFVIPVEGGGIVLRHARAVAVHPAEIALGLPVALLRQNREFPEGVGLAARIVERDRAREIGVSWMSAK
jgi:hypothetical protein